MAKDTGFQDVTQVAQLLQNLAKLLEDGTKKVSRGATSTVKKDVTDLIDGIEKAQEESLKTLSEKTQEAIKARKEAEDAYLAAREAKQRAATDDNIKAEADAFNKL